jgi:hypothetical protein
MFLCIRPNRFVTDAYLRFFSPLTVLLEPLFLRLLLCAGGALTGAMRLSVTSRLPVHVMAACPDVVSRRFSGPGALLFRLFRHDQPFAVVVANSSACAAENDIRSDPESRIQSSLHSLGGSVYDVMRQRNR